MFDYLRDADEIYRRSFQTVRAEADLDALPEQMRGIATRLVHTCAMPDIVTDLAYSAAAAAAGRAALDRGAPILVDTAMVGAGINRRLLAAANPVVCLIGRKVVADRAASMGTTRAAAQVEYWVRRLSGAVVAIGNAPTALFRLLEVLAEGAPPPALILGFPVGFVGAAESKEALIAHAGAVPYVTLRGRRGGAAMAAAAVNALAGAPS